MNKGANMNAVTYYPEMNEAKPAADFEANVTFGGKWRVKTAREVSGRGIAFDGNLSGSRSHIRVYTMTKAAFNNFSAGKTVAIECLL